MRAMRLLVGLGVLGLIACGESAEDQCKEMVDALCDKVAECSKTTGDEALDLENKCLRSLKPACSEAKDEVDDIDDCVDAIKGASCNDFETDDPDTVLSKLRACKAD